MEQSPSWKADWFVASQEIPCFFYGTRKFLTALTSAHHLSLSWASTIQSSRPHPNSWRSILTLSSHLRLGLPSGLFPSGFPTRTLCTTLPSLPCATCPVHLNLLDFITRTKLGKEYRPFSSSLCLSNTCKVQNISQNRDYQQIWNSSLGTEDGSLLGCYVNADQ
jgi:hypothetical protein